MSIIYDALQKMQKNQSILKAETVKPEYSPKKVRNVGPLLWGFLILSGILVFTGWGFSFISIYHPTPQKPRLTLNGVFLSPQEQIAVINQRSFHIGDKINDLQIVSIQRNGVTLRKGKHSFMLDNDNA